MIKKFREWRMSNYVLVRVGPVNAWQHPRTGRLYAGDGRRVKISELPVEEVS